MYSSYSVFRRLILVHFLAVQLLIRSISSLNLTNAYLAHKCRVNEEIDEGNLNYLTRLISDESFKINYGFLTYGKPPVSIIYGCRGDTFGSNCRSCFKTGVDGLLRKCKKNHGGGIIWYDQCFLEVTNNTIKFPRLMEYNDTFYLHNSKAMSGDTKTFNQKYLWDFFHKLTQESTRKQKNSDEPINYATGEKKLGTNKLYAMVQCAKDITTALCHYCLEWSLGELSKCCNAKQGARVLNTVCNLRYELYPFLRSQKTV